jgi:hypothetical protein
MNSHSEHPTKLTPSRHWFRRFGGLVGIIFILLNLIVICVDVAEWWESHYRKPQPGETEKTFSQSMNEKLDDQLAKIKDVDALGLLGVFDKSLETEECDWLFFCHLRPVATVPSTPVLVHRYSYAGSLEAMDRAQAIIAQNKPVFPLPTLTARPVQGSLTSPSEDAARIQARIQANLAENPTDLKPKTAVIPAQKPGASLEELLRDQDAPASAPSDAQALTEWHPQFHPIPGPTPKTPPSIYVPPPDVPLPKSAFTSPPPIVVPHPTLATSGPGNLVHIPDPKPLIDPAADTQFTFFDHFYRFGPILIPRWDTIRGTPHGLLRMMAAIWRAGWRAVALYLSCAVIYFFLWLAALNLKDDNSGNGLLVYSMMILSPFSISLMVSLVQLLAIGALHTFGWALGGFSVILAHAAALALLVDGRHIFKAPRELIEEVEKLA